MWVFLAILSVPLIEIGLFVTLGGAIGLWPTLAWVILTAALGILVLKGVAMYGAVTLSRDMSELRDPLSPIAHRVMVVLAAGLLILPGFFTDALGLLLLIPPVRLVLIKLIGRRLARTGNLSSQAVVIEGEWEEADWQDAADGPDGPQSKTIPPASPTRH
jgi:UPF0716 protein FxsA